MAVKIGPKIDWHISLDRRTGWVCPSVWVRLIIASGRLPLYFVDFLDVGAQLCQCVWYCSSVLALFLHDPMSALIVARNYVSKQVNEAM